MRTNRETTTIETFDGVEHSYWEVEKEACENKMRFEVRHDGWVVFGGYAAPHIDIEPRLRVATGLLPISVRVLMPAEWQ
jgi:hypothetical protein